MDRDNYCTCHKDPFSLATLPMIEPALILWCLVCTLYVTYNCIGWIKWWATITFLSFLCLLHFMTNKHCARVMQFSILAKPVSGSAGMSLVCQITCKLVYTVFTSFCTMLPYLCVLSHPIIKSDWYHAITHLCPFRLTSIMLSYHVILHGVSSSLTGTMVSYSSPSSSLTGTMVS